MMAKMTISSSDEILKRKEYVTVGEPCCGSGAMVLGFASAMADCKHNFHRQMVVQAMDIDLKCVFMTYIQLSLYGIPAVVIHGDTIAAKEWSHWYTPVYVIDRWYLKKEEEPKKEEVITVPVENLEVGNSMCAYSMNPIGQFTLF